MGSINGGRENSSYFPDWFLKTFGVAPEDYQGPDTPERPPRRVARQVERVIRRESTHKPKRAPKRKTKKRTRREQRARDAKYYARARAEMLAALRKDGFEGDYIQVIRRDVWVMSWHIVSDRKGKAGRYYLDRCHNKAYAAAVRRAAFDGGRRRRPWTSDRARLIVAAGLALHALSHRTRRRGRFNPIVRGVSKGGISALLKDLDSKHTPAPNTLIGRSRWTGHYTNGQCGYLTALYQAGAIYFEQLAPEKVSPWERIETARGIRAINRYWLTTNNPEDVDNPDHRRRIIELAQSEVERAHPDDVDQVDGDPVAESPIEDGTPTESRAPP